MDLTLSASIVEFEVYLLMTMKPRLSLADTRGLLDAKLSKAAVTLDAAVRIHDRIAQVLSEETSRFRHLQILLGVQEEGVASLRYRSELWPGFEFNASAGLNGQIESAGYVHAQRAALDFKSPTQLAPWSVDIREFDEHFGPASRRGKRPLFDDILPAYEEYEFLWEGDRYGAGFLWGIFLSASAYWE